MRILLIAVSVAALASAASAETLGPEGMGLLRQYYPSANQPQGISSPQAPNREHVARQVRDVTLGDARKRIAAGLVRKGRCDEALLLAERQHDKMLAQQLTTTCAMAGGVKPPT